MENKISMKELERFLLFLISKNGKSNLKFYLNSPDSLKIISTDTTFDLYVDDNVEIFGSSTVSELNIPISCHGTSTINLHMEVPLKIESTNVYGSTVEKEIYTYEKNSSYTQCNVECNSEYWSKDDEFCYEDQDLYNYYHPCTEECDKPNSYNPSITFDKNYDSCKLKFKIPELDLNARTEEQEGILKFTGKSDVEMDSFGDINTTIPELNVSGIAKTQGVKVNGNIDIKPCLLSEPTAYDGIVTELSCGILTLTNTTTNETTVFGLNDVLKFEFISKNKLFKGFINTNNNDDIKTLEDKLRLETNKKSLIKLIGRNTNTAISDLINTKNIEYIFGGIMIVSEVTDNLYNYSVYNLENIIGYTTKN